MHKGPFFPTLSELEMKHLRNRGWEGAGRDDNKLFQHQSCCQSHSKRPTGACFSDRAIQIDSICCVSQELKVNTPTIQKSYFCTFF